jgi:type I restriction enzyme M protein
VSRVLANVVGISKARKKSEGITLYDPACGSASLLIRTAEAAPFEVAIYGQEKDITTAGLARMNLFLHNKATAEIKGGYSTFSDPQYFNPKNDSALRQFDYIVVNPPFSDKNWTHGLKEYGRFDGYGDRPPQKNGDFAWLLHILKSLKRNGKAAVILPHGVLFRGNAEANIRRAIIDNGYIKGIIGLPANLFFGTGIPACIIVIDKENTGERDGVFMIDASREFTKDGNKNRLRERDIHKIVTVFNEQVEIPCYSRFILNDEIKNKNAYNLNIPRYIDGGSSEDLQNIDAHLNGGIPDADIKSLSLYWDTFPKLKRKLFKPFRKGFYLLTVNKDEIRNTIYGDTEFSAYADKVETAFENWKARIDKKFRTINGSTKQKRLIAEIAEMIIEEFEPVTLVDKYDTYQVLLSYWNSIMADDVYLIAEEGYKAIRETENITKTSEKKNKDGTKNKKTTVIGWEGKLVPKALVIEMFFSAEQKAIDETETVISGKQAELDLLLEMDEELSEHEVPPDIEIDLLKNEIRQKARIVKELKSALDKRIREKYPKLTDAECLELLLERKWYAALVSGIYALYETVNHRIADRIAELTERYEVTLPALEAEVTELESKMKSHLERMGFA